MQAKRKAIAYRLIGYSRNFTSRFQRSIKARARRLALREFHLGVFVFDHVNADSLFIGRAACSAVLTPWASIGAGRGKSTSALLACVLLRRYVSSPASCASLRLV